MLKRRPRWTVVALGAAVAVAAAVSIFFWIDRSRVAKAPSPPAAETSHAVTPEQLAKLAEQLEARLRQAPDDAAGWVMLARSRITLARFDAAAEAYAEAAALRPKDADLLADYADALAMARGRKLAGEPLEIVRRALEIDPDHVKSLALAGSAEFEAKRYAAAVAHWEHALRKVGTESDFGRSIQRSIGQARELGQLPVASAAAARDAPAKLKPPVATAPASKAGASTAGAVISGTVRLAPELASKIAPGDALFIFARAAEGVRTPLAIVRVTAAELPYAFKLDDSQASSPQLRLSAQQSLVVIARVSKTGNAMAKPGDLEGSSKPLAPGSRGVELIIDQVRTEARPGGHS